MQVARRSNTGILWMKAPWLLVMMLLSGTFVFAQPGGPHGMPHKDKGSENGRPDREKIEAMRIGYLTTELNLSTEEAQAFWPVYNEFRAEMREVREQKKARCGMSDEAFNKLNDKELENFIDQRISYEERQLEVMKKYNEKFRKVLSTKKVAMLYRAEDGFKRHLVREARDRRDDE